MALKLEVLPVEITFTEPVLGTKPGDKDVAAEFVVGKLLDSLHLTPGQRSALYTDTTERKAFIKSIAAGGTIDMDRVKSLPSEVADRMQEELEAVEAEGDIGKASTKFPRDEDGTPMLWDYQIKGFLKEACQALMIGSEQYTQEQLKKLKLTPYLYKRTIDKQIFVKDRRIRLTLPDGTDPNTLEYFERPLRADTARGERICLARSEVVPAGTKLKTSLQSLNKNLLREVPDWLDYGQLLGIGQFRTGSYGRFTWAKA